MASQIGKGNLLAYELGHDVQALANRVRWRKTTNSRTQPLETAPCQCLGKSIADHCPSGPFGSVRS